MFSEGGFWVWAIFATQVVSIAIIAERFYALYIARSPNQKNIAKTFEVDIKKGNLERVVQRGGSMVSEPVANLAVVGAKTAQEMGGREEIQLKMEEVVLEETSRLEKRTSFLAMLGNVSTLLGLLGTVVGLIKAFASIGAADAVAKSTMLASGISEAMNTTAYGLVAAIPALIMYGVLQNRTNVLVEDLNKAALKMFIWLSYGYDSVPTKKVSNK